MLRSSALRDTRLPTGQEPKEAAMRKSLSAGVVAAVAASAFTGVGTGGTSATASYHPKIDPSQFTTKITNPYLPLRTGTTHRYSGVRDGASTRHVMTVTRQTRTVMGVKCVVVTDDV